MAISLTKGARFNLTKEAPSLKKVTVGLGWDANTTDSGSDFDLDASVFMLNEHKKIPSEKFFVFFNNLKSEDGSVIHHGDNLTGGGKGDDEIITIELEKVDPRIQEILFVVTIYEYDIRKQNFGQVSNSYIRLLDDQNKELAKYELDEDFSTETAIEFGRLYRKDGTWRFQAVGMGYNKGLDAFVEQHFS
jgi:tellurium resistance protein TerD